MDDPSRSVHLHPPDVVSDVHDVHVEHNGRQISAGSWVCCMPCYWLRTNNSLHKASLTVVTLLVTSLLVASPVLFLISSVPANEQPYKDCTSVDEDDCFADKPLNTPVPICDTPECKDLARRIKFSLSWDVDPCRDFYKFSCGGWAEAHKAKNRRPMPALGMDLSFSTILTTINLQIQQLLSLNATSGRFKKLGAFYSSCLVSFDKSVDMSPMFMVIDKLGGYLPQGSLGPNDITPLVANILKANGAPLLDVYLDRDFQNRSSYAIIIDLPRDISSQRSFYGGDLFESSPVRFSKYKNFHARHKFSRKRREINKQSVYYTYIKDKHLEKKLYSLERVVIGMLPKGMPAKQKAIDTQQILLFATTSEQLIPRRKELREHIHEAMTAKPYNLDTLQEAYPFLTWSNLFKEIFPSEKHTNGNIYVISRQYLLSVSDMISRFQKRVVQNALLALFARDFLYVIANHTAAADDRNLFCTHVTTKAFSQAVSALYLTQYSQNYLNDIHDRAAEMFHQLKMSLFSRVERAGWLDEDTKRVAMNRLSSMTANFIAWPPLRNATFVDELLLTLNVTDDFFENVVSRHREVRELQMKAVDGLYMNLSWPYPFVVNAFYEADDNAVVVPLALLTQPHFVRGAPSYVAYGTVGNVVAHEMLHALDDGGYVASSSSETDATAASGLMGAEMASQIWMKSKSASVLRERLDCLAKHHKARDLRFMGYQMRLEFDGNATREETAADVGGARVAWGAWRGVAGATGGPSLPPLPLPPVKLFYLAMAQMYCTELSPEDYIIAVENDFHMTAPERVNSLVRNAVSFAEAFQCPVGTPMNPASKCIIW